MHRPEQSGETRTYESGKYLFKEKEARKGSARWCTTSGGRRLCTDRSGAEKLERTSPAGLVYHKEGIQMDAFFVIKRARDGTRTRDPDLGKVVLHQLSHSRIYD